MTKNSTLLITTPMNTTSFMDKQIMDLSQGSSQHNNVFLDLMNHSQEEEQQVGQVNGISKKEEILPNYDFQPLRPIVGATSQSPSFDATPSHGGGGGGSTKGWNSTDSKSNTNTPIRVINRSLRLSFFLVLVFLILFPYAMRCCVIHFCINLIETLYWYASGS